MNNLYEITDMNNISLNYWGKSYNAVRKDFECARPGEKIHRIKLIY